MTHRSPRSRPTGFALIWLWTVGLVTVLSLLGRVASAQSPDGFWQSEGYGLLVQIESAKLRTFQITSISCIPWWTAQRRSNSNNHTDDVVFDRGDAEIRLTAGSSPDVLLMREGRSISRVMRKLAFTTGC